MDWSAPKSVPGVALSLHPRLCNAVAPSALKIHRFVGRAGAHLATSH